MAVGLSERDKQNADDNWVTVCSKQFVRISVANDVISAGARPVVGSIRIFIDVKQHSAIVCVIALGQSPGNTYSH